MAHKLHTSVPHGTKSFGTCTWGCGHSRFQTVGRQQNENHPAYEKTARALIRAMQLKVIATAGQRERRASKHEALYTFKIRSGPCLTTCYSCQHEWRCRRYLHSQPCRYCQPSLQAHLWQEQVCSAFLFLQHYFLRPWQAFVGASSFASQ